MRIAAMGVLVGLFALSTAGTATEHDAAGGDSTKADSGATVSTLTRMAATTGPTTLHCFQAVAAQGILARQEIWTRGDRMRAEMLQIGDRELDPPVISIQVKGSIYTFKDGDSKGNRIDLPPGLARLPLLEQFERVRRQGEKTGVVDMDGAPFGEAGMLKLDVYHYAAAAESVEAWFNPRNLVPIRWLSKVRTGDSQDQALMVFSRVEINVSIPDSLLEVPKGIVFPK